MNRILKCVITDKPVRNLGSKNACKHQDPRVDGVSTHIGVVHASVIREFEEARPAVYEHLSPVDDTRGKLESMFGVDITSKQEHNQGNNL